MIDDYNAQIESEVEKYDLNCGIKRWAYYKNFNYNGGYSYIFDSSKDADIYENAIKSLRDGTKTLSDYIK